MARWALLVLSAMPLVVGCSDSAGYWRTDSRLPPIDAGVDPGPDRGPATDLNQRQDGQVACSGCHGSDKNAAPPSGSAGQSQTTDRAVGAHQAHLGTSDWHAEVRCEDCHLVPKSVADPGHLDGTPALTFSAAASADGAKPSWDGKTCAGSYCHGATLDGGLHTNPEWTKVDGSQSGCTSCHAMPPGGTHPDNGACATCHGAVVNTDFSFKAPELHINGKVEVSAGHPSGYISPDKHGADFNAAKSCVGSGCHGDDLKGGAGPTCETCHSGWQTNCTFCHGGDKNKTGAPPESVSGATSSSVKAVGAHTEHVTAGGRHGAYDCGICHTKPTSALSPGHIDGSAQVSFSGIAAGSSYDSSSGSCSNVYCHGNGRGTGGNASWTGTLSGACNQCHDDDEPDNSTLSGKHKKHLEKGIGCATCHSCVIDSNGTFNTPAKHVDGNVDFCRSGGTTGNCAQGCHQGQWKWD